jgi:hypothetical protein
MAKKKFTTVNADEFFKSQKAFPTLTVNNGNIGGELNLETGQGLTNPLTNRVDPIANAVEESTVVPRVRGNKNRGGKRNLRKFKKVEEQVITPRRKPISLKDFRFPYEIDGIPGDISPEELAKARSLLPKNKSLDVAQSVTKGTGRVVNAGGQEIISPRRGKNRGGRGGRRSSVPTPHIDELSDGSGRSGLSYKIRMQLGNDFFKPEKIVSKNGNIRYVNPLNKHEVIYTIGKNGRIKYVNPKFVVDPDDNVVRLANASQSFDRITGQIWHSGPTGEVDALRTMLPVPKHGAPVTSVPSIYDAYGEGVARPLTVPERAAFDHRQKMRKKYNSKRRPDYDTRSTRAERERRKAAGVFDYGEDVGNTFNIERRKHTVGRYSGSVEEYKAKVAQYIRELETELSYLDAGSAKKTRKVIIQDILTDLRRELRKNADQINPTQTGLPHKLELRVIEALKGEGQILNRMVGDVADLSRDARFVSNKIALNEIATMGIPDTVPSPSGGDLSVSHMQKMMVKADIMQDKLPKSVIDRHIKDKDFMNSYMKGGRVDQYVMRPDGTLDFRYPTKKETILRGPNSRIKVGQAVRDTRKQEAAAKKQEDKIKELRARQTARENRRAAQEAAENNYTPSFVRRVKDANQASATISSAPMPGSSAAGAATDTATRAGSRVADMLGEDTVRAASVIHSSKLNYAAVGLAGMAAVFGIASAGRQRKNVEQEIQSRF